jgi:hypothetical protein
MELLESADDLIKNPDTWTTGAYARDTYGNYVPPLDSRAVRWCAEGALMKAIGPAPEPMHVTMVRLAATAGVDFLSLVEINDTQGRQAVVALFKKALAA